jgi:2-keto-4-pentenoate hydratase/2-oxohepta-3-ene-1,7-dioic acid hydratase in catechol pathway
LGGGALVAEAESKSVKAAPTNEWHSFEMPCGMTLLTLSLDGEYRLGFKTSEGVLDVTRAAAHFKMPAPSTMDDLLQNGKGGLLKKLVDAVAKADCKRFILAEDRVEYGPVVMKPETVIMMGFNYRRHAAETHTPIPPNPVLFNKYNNALNRHNGIIHFRLPRGAA